MFRLFLQKDAESPDFEFQVFPVFLKKLNNLNSFKYLKMNIKLKTMSRLTSANLREMININQVDIDK